jgi:hypothetical protein
MKTYVNREKVLLLTLCYCSQGGKEKKKKKEEKKEEKKAREKQEEAWRRVKAKASSCLQRAREGFHLGRAVRR